MYSKTKNIVRSVTLFYIFASLFTVLLNRRQLIFTTAVILFVVIYLKYMKKTQPYPDI